MKILYFLIRIFLKISGFIPYLLILKPKFIYASEKAKEASKGKNGAILVSNHNDSYDYYTLLYHYPFRLLHTFVGEIIYDRPFLSFLNKIMGNIRINRNDGINVLALEKAKEILNKKGLVLIFPEGHYEKEKGNIEDIKGSAALLALKTNKPIIPFFISGEKGLFKRETVIILEPIYISENKDELEEKINKINRYISKRIHEGKNIYKNHKKYKTQTLFTLKYWVNDFMKITSVPIFYIIFPTKKYYLGKKKDIKKALKHSFVLASNHLGFKDPFFMYMHFFSRRIKIVANEELWKQKLLVYAFERSGVIKYHRDSMDHFDIEAYKECLDTLSGKGGIGIFPEGHIVTDGELDKRVKGGAAMMSLLTNSPIILFFFLNSFDCFRKNEVIMCEPIYPDKYFDMNKPIDKEKINTFNNIVYSKMLEALKKGNEIKNGKKTRNIK